MRGYGGLCGDCLNGESCGTLGYLAGSLTCAADCAFDLGSCSMPVCGSDPSPPGDAQCPAACDSCNTVTNTCMINCNSSGCDNVAVDCPQNWACEVTCDGTSACDGATINCPDAYTCDILCDGTVACSDAVFNCGDASCNVECTGTAPCEGSDFYCGQRDSTLECTQITNVNPDPVPHPDGASSCTCDVIGC